MNVVLNIGYSQIGIAYIWIMFLCFYLVIFCIFLIQNGSLCRQSEEVLEALLQFMKLFPYMSGGHTTSGHTPVYAFGESYGGSYVISLAKVYLNYR